MENDELEAAAEHSESATEGKSASETKALGPSVSSELEALRIDLEAARKEAAQHETALAAKEGEVSKLKELFDKARQHLITLQTSVNQLREERHRLANQVMEIDALRAKLTIVTLERDRLREELNNRVRWRD